MHDDRLVRPALAVNVGGLDVRKNLPALVEAFARVLPRLSDPADLVIAGSAHTGNRPSVEVEPDVAASLRALGYFA